MSSKAAHSPLRDNPLAMRIAEEQTEVSKAAKEKALNGLRKGIPFSESLTFEERISILECEVGAQKAQMLRQNATILAICDRIISDHPEFVMTLVSLMADDDWDEMSNEQ